jgi:hypothetical protein
VSPKAQVFGDARYVFLIETTQFNLTRSRVLRAVDGSTVEGVKDFSSVFTSSDRVAVLGRHILLGEGRGAVTRALRLYDPLAGKDVWRKEFPRDTVLIKTLDPELTGAMMSDGTFEVLSARTGQSVFRGGIDKDRAAAHMSDPAGGRVSPLILADGERFYLFLNRQHDAAQRYGGYSMIRSVPVNGVVYGFDRATGKRLWFYEGLFQNQSLLAERFDELPALIAAAQVPDENTKMPVYKVTILDKQLGKLLHNKGYPAQSVFTSMVSPDPKNPRVIELSRHDLRIRIVPDDTGTRPITSASAVP